MQLIKTAMGFFMYVDPDFDGGLERHLYVNKIYEARILSIIKTCLNSTDIFIDVGSNVGLMSILTSNTVGNNGFVYSFEPVKSTWSILNKNIEINRCFNITSINKALGDEEKEQKIFYARRNRGGSSFVNNGSDGNEFTEIDCLDNYENLIGKVKLIKIDVEGFELKVLKGASKFLVNKNLPILIIECTKENSIPIFNFIKSFDIYTILITQNSVFSSFMHMQKESDFNYFDKYDMKSFLCIPKNYSDIFIHKLQNVREDGLSVCRNNIFNNPINNVILTA